LSIIGDDITVVARYTYRLTGRTKKASFYSSVITQIYDYIHYSLLPKPIFTLVTYSPFLPPSLPVISTSVPRVFGDVHPLNRQQRYRMIHVSYGLSLVEHVAIQPLHPAPPRAAVPRTRKYAQRKRYRHHRNCSGCSIRFVTIRANTYPALM